MPAVPRAAESARRRAPRLDRKSTRLNSSHSQISYAVFCLNNERYSTDARWLAPHFEKMLYDNAELTTLLTLGWQETREPLYAQRVAETICWLAREQTHPPC